MLTLSSEISGKTSELTLRTAMIPPTMRHTANRLAATEFCANQSIIRFIGRPALMQAMRYRTSAAPTSA